MNNYFKFNEEKDFSNWNVTGRKDNKHLKVTRKKK